MVFLSWSRWDSYLRCKSDNDESRWGVASTIIVIADCLAASPPSFQGGFLIFCFPPPSTGLPTAIGCGDFPMTAWHQRPGRSLPSSQAPRYICRWPWQGNAKWPRRNTPELQTLITREEKVRLSPEALGWSGSTGEHWRRPGHDDPVQDLLQVGPSVPGWLSLVCLVSAQVGI